MKQTVKLKLGMLGIFTLLFFLVGCGGPKDVSFDLDSHNNARASITTVSSFGSNPGNLKMFKYVPANPKPNAGLVVALHGCTQNASEYATQTGWSTLADKYGFYVIYAEQNSSNNSSRCFNWFETKHISRGQGEALSIVNMVNKMKADYSIDNSKVFVTGLSAGGYMTATMMATYPDVFSGGAVMAGGPYRCATSMTAAFNCMSPGVDKTPAQWKTLVKQGHSSYNGTYPTLMAFHGTTDHTVKELNMTELMDQWTAVHEIDQTPDKSETIAGNEVKHYQNAAGKTLVKTYRIIGMGHAITVNPGTGEEQGGATGGYSVNKGLHSSYHAAEFWGLTNKDPEPPVVTITSPANNATLDKVATISANATDNEGVAKVEFFIGGVLKSTKTVAPYSFSWDTSNEYNGEYTLLVKATDTSGNTAEESIKVKVDKGKTDTTPPVITADKKSGTYQTSVTVSLSTNKPATIYYTTDGTAPNTNSSVYSTPLTFTADTTLKFLGKDASDNTSTVVTENYIIDIVEYSEVESGTCTEHYMGSRLDVSSYVACGQKYGYTAAVDMFKLKSNGSWVYEDQLNSYETDTENPTVSFTSPSNGSEVSENVTFKVNATDNKGVSKVEFYVNNTLKATKTAAPYEYTFDSKSVSNGSVTVKAKAYDAANNTAEATINVTVNNENNHQQPIETLEVDITSHTSGATVDKKQTLIVKGTSEGAVQVIVKLMGGNSNYEYKTVVISNSVINWSASFTGMTWYMNGPYKIVVDAKNAKGEIITKEIPINLQ